MENISLSSVISVLILIAAIVITFLFIVMTAKRFKEWYQYKKIPLKTMHAKIIDKHIESSWNSLPDTLYGSSPAPSADFCMLFELEDGEKLDLSVPEKVYDHSTFDDTGKLTFKKDAFVSFEKDEKTDSADVEKDLTVTNVPEQNAD